MTARHETAIEIANYVLENQRVLLGTTPRVHIYSVEPSEHFYDAYRSMIAHAEAQAGPSADARLESYVLSIRSVAEEILQGQGHWVTDRPIPSSSVIDVEVWERTPIGNALTDAGTNASYQATGGSPSTRAYEWPASPESALPASFETYEMEPDWGLVSPALFPDDSSDSGIEDSARIVLPDAGKVRLYRMASGVYHRTKTPMVDPYASCRLAPTGYSRTCSERASRVPSSDGWQRQDATFSLRQEGTNAVVDYSVSGQQYYWGLKWYNNKYLVVTWVDIIVETLEGKTFSEVRDARNGYPDYSPGAYTVSASIEVPADAPYVVKIQTRTRGMWWIDHIGSQIFHDQIFDVS